MDGQGHLLSCSGQLKIYRLYGLASPIGDILWRYQRYRMDGQKRTTEDRATQPMMCWKAESCKNPGGGIQAHEKRAAKIGLRYLIYPYCWAPPLQFHGMVKVDSQEMQKCVWTWAVCKHVLLVGGEKAFPVIWEEKERISSRWHLTTVSV